jgi:hypothetical protein
VCGKELIRKSRLKSPDNFLSDARLLHGDKYDYSKVEYVDGGVKIEVVCKEHDLFKIRPKDHLQGSACPGCNWSGFNKSKPAILYYLRIETYNQLAYKVGITNRTVEDRYRIADYEKITTVKEFHYDTGQDAYDREQVKSNICCKFHSVGSQLSVS